MSAIEMMSLLNAKTQSFRPVGGGGVPDVTWHDVCGAISSLPPLLQEYAYLLHNPRLGRQKLAFVTLLAGIVAREVASAGLKCRGQSLADLCAAIAATALVQALNPNLKLTRAERMQAGGITLSEEAYRKRWEGFELSVIQRLVSWQAEIEYRMGDYMREVRKVGWVA